MSMEVSDEIKEIARKKTPDYRARTTETLKEDYPTKDWPHRYRKAVYGGQ